MCIKRCALCLFIKAKGYADEFVEMAGRKAKLLNGVRLQLSQVDGQRGNL
jgi:hypothetical protein